MAIASFVVIFVTVDAFEHFSRWVDRDVTAGTFARYYFYGLPYVIVLVMPVALLLSSLFLVGALAKRNEFVAMRCAGISIPRIFLPMLLVGLLASVFVLVVGDFVVPESMHRQAVVKRVEIDGRDPVDYARRSNFAYRTLSGAVVEIGYYDGSIATMRTASVEWYDDSTSLQRKVWAGSIVHDGESWIAYDAIEREFGPGGAEYYVEHDTLPVPEIIEGPADFGTRQKSTDEMNFFELMAYIERVRSAGGDVRGDLVELYLKIFFPLSNLVMVLVGAPLAARNPRSGKSISVGLAILLAFIFFSTLRFGQTLGHKGSLHPILAAGLADLIFIAGGLVLLYRTSRH
jgi:lipopolysaccharide export system permease protein